MDEQGSPVRGHPARVPGTDSPVIWNDFLSGKVVLTLKRFYCAKKDGETVHDEQKIHGLLKRAIPFPFFWSSVRMPA